MLSKRMIKCISNEDMCKMCERCDLGILSEKKEQYVCKKILNMVEFLAKRKKGDLCKLTNFSCEKVYTKFNYELSMEEWMCGAIVDF
jgi:hypothetical protein